MGVNLLVSEIGRDLEQFLEANGEKEAATDVDAGTIFRAYTEGKNYDPQFYDPFTEFEKDCKEAGIIATRTGTNQAPRYTVTLRV